MGDTICLTTLLKQARLDLKAAQLEYEDMLRRFPLSEEEARIVDALFLNEMSIDDVYALSVNVSNVAEAYHAKVKCERIRSIVDNFVENPLSVEYRNTDFNIPCRYYDQIRDAQAPPQSAPAPKARRRDDYLSVVLPLAGRIVTLALALIGCGKVADWIHGSFGNGISITCMCIAFSTLFPLKPKNK